MKLKEFLKKYKMTAYRFGKLFGFPKASISDWLSGKTPEPHWMSMHLAMLDYYYYNEQEWPINR